MSQAIGLKDLFKDGSAVRLVILGISSDIGLALGLCWALRGHEVYGTYRKRSEKLAMESGYFKGLYCCDLKDLESIDFCTSRLRDEIGSWDAMLLCPGTMEPIGRFDKCDFDQWTDGVSVNLTAPLRFLQKCLCFRSQYMPTVIFFAGGGSNSAPQNVSSYTLAKIALIKATELLDAEFEDIKFSIVGPGWVETKIHQETLRADDANPIVLNETKRRLASHDFNSMESVLECCDWIIGSPKSVVGGRNFSATHDDFHDGEFSKKLAGDSELLKLRRNGN